LEQHTGGPKPPLQIITGKQKKNDRQGGSGFSQPTLPHARKDEGASMNKSKEKSLKEKNNGVNRKGWETLGTKNLSNQGRK